MISSYNIVKEKYPDISTREIYAHALSLRPTWKRKSDDSFTFTRDLRNLVIEEKDTFEDVVRNIIILETMPFGSSRNQDYAIKTLKDITVVVIEEFKNFKE